jgi:exopolysaccharide biosynthesis polyprenyl glycosylphosphotransferase
MTGAQRGIGVAGESIPVLRSPPAQGSAPEFPLNGGATHGSEPGESSSSGPPGEEGWARRSPPLRRILAAVDLTVIGVGFLAGWLVTSRGLPSPDLVVALLVELVLVLAAGALILSANGLYRRRICQVRSVELARTGRSVAMLSVLFVLLSVTATRPQGHTLFWGTLVAGATWFGLLAIERGLLREWIVGRRATGAFAAPVLVVGGDPGSRTRLAEFLSENPVLGFEVRGVAGPREPGVERDRFAWRGDAHDLGRLAVECGVSGAVLDATSLNGQLNPAVRALSEANLHVHVFSGLRGIERRRITLAALADETLLHVRPVTLERRQEVAKRVLDVVVASTLLVLLSPLLLLSAVLVRLQDGGPVLFRQQRIGQDGEPFMLYKLRTMTTCAEEQRAALAEQNGRNGPLFKLVRDPRVTPIGRLLRAISLDEAPQLCNVLEGTMSMVGPRPALPDEAAQFDEELTTRLSVKPGLTGLWQVEARDLPSFDLYRRYDLLYVQNWSIGVDIAVLVRTAAVVGMRACRGLVPERLRRTESELME